MIQLDAITTLLLAALVLVVGHLIVERVRVLREFNIPEPVVGGLIATIIVTGLRGLGYEFQFFGGLQTPFMLLFFGSVGLSADVRMIRAGGSKLVLFLALVIGLLILQNLLGVGVASLFGLDPVLGLLGGSITMSGGHGTGAAWANVFADEYGINGAMEVAMACATFGLVFGSLIGGPTARFLINRMKREGQDINAQVSDSEYDETEVQHPLNTSNALKTLFMLLLGVVCGQQLQSLTSGTAFSLPTFVWVLFSCIVIGNVVRAFGDKHLNTHAVDVLGNISLSIFLALALMTLKLWDLANLALPILAILLAQVALVFLYTTQVTFRLMGKNYDAAVLVAGNCGFGMGATPTAIANMQAVTQHHGQSRLAFIIVPVVGGFLIDIANSLIIKGFLGFF